MGSQNRSRLHGLVILHEDRDILVVDKPAGLLTIATDSERSRTAYFILMDYVRKGNPKSRNRIFIVHRLDKETSGVLIFAKSEDAKRQLQDQWPETEKTYLAIVHGTMKKKSDTITTYLAENTAHVVYSTPNPAKGKLSHTAYRVLRETKDLSLLEINLLTGRKHQIRVHLSSIGHPVVGDRKYGLQNDASKRLALHASTITFTHPFTGKLFSCIANTPGLFSQLVRETEVKWPPARRPGQ